MCSVRKQVAWGYEKQWCWEVLQRSFRVDVCVNYLDCDGGFTGVYMCRNLLDHTFYVLFTAC